MNKKYDISKEFGFFGKFKPPFSKSAVQIGAGFIKNCYKFLQNEKDVVFDRFDLGGFSGQYIRPKEGENFPCLIFLHGGGFCFPAYKSHYKAGLEYLRGCGAAVLFVDYRLSPKNPFPQAELDARLALDWVFENYSELLVDVNKIGIVGDSAGGNLAAKLSRYAKIKGYDLKCQAFIYPVVDPDLDTESKKTFTDTPMWNSRLNEKMWNYYFDGKDFTVANYEKILSKDFTLSDAPSYVEVAEYDCLKDEGLALASYLLSHGVRVECSTVKGAMHGFDCVDCDITKNAFKNRIEFFRRSFKD